MRVSVRVKPNSKHARIEPAGDGTLIVHVKASPVDGRANEELIGALARHYGVPKTHVRIKTGFTARLKIVDIGF